MTGDAVCSLNPVYAQGMSVAIGEARALGQILDQHGLDRVGPRFFQRTKRTIDEAWTMATGADLGYPAVEGPRPARWRLINAYVNRLLRVAHHDPVVATAFMAVNGMVAPPQHLMRPRIVSRVFDGDTTPSGPKGVAHGASHRWDRDDHGVASPRRRLGRPPPRADNPETRTGRMPEMTITSADGTRLAARHSGHGSPMVLVHGAIGSLETFALIEGMLAERHSVWVYSRRGRGGSGDGPHYGLDREVEDVLAVLAAAGDHAHLLGHSGGAMYCLLAATQRPSLRSLVLYEPPFHGDRFDPNLVDAVQAALDAGDPDQALEIFLSAGVAVDEEVQIIRSLPEVWARAREGVCLVPRELRTAHEAIDRLDGVRPAGHPDALPLRREDGRLDVPYRGRSSRTVAESSAPPPSRPAAPRLRLRPNTIRPGDPAVHHRTRPLSTPRSSVSTGRVPLEASAPC